MITMARRKPPRANISLNSRRRRESYESDTSFFNTGNNAESDE